VTSAGADSVQYGEFLVGRCFYFSSTPVHFFIYSYIYSFICLNSICLNTETVFHNFMSLHNYSRGVTDRDKQSSYM
jgi:hypothetical protein